MASKQSARSAKAKSNNRGKGKRNQPAQAKPTGVRGWYRETVGEWRRVSWPSQTEARNLTWIVIVVMVVMALFLGGLDFLFFEFFRWLFNL